MKLLGKCCLAVSFPASVAGGYGIYALASGGQTSQSVSNVDSTGLNSATQTQNQLSEPATQTRSSEPEEASNSGLSETTRSDENQRTQNVVPQQNPETVSSPKKSPSNFKWVLGEERRGGKKLLVQVKEDLTIEDGGNLKFGTEFTVSADNQKLDAGYILCVANAGFRSSQNNKYFLMKWDSSDKKYKTLNGEAVATCSWVNDPKGNVTRYSITGWSETSQRSNSLRDVRQIDLSTCSISGKDWNSDSGKLKMHCKESTNEMLWGRPSNTNIYIELKVA